MRSELSEIFEDELAEAANNLEIAEGEDDQEALRQMILSLQQSAYERGLVSAIQSESEEPASQITEVTSEQLMTMMSSLFKHGEARIRIVVNDDLF